MQKIIRRRQSPSQRLAFLIQYTLLQHIGAARGVRSDDEIQTDLSAPLPPQSPKGLPEAVDLLITALEQQQRLLVVGDFDADGATSSAALALIARSSVG